MSFVLKICGWYPSKQDALSGDFVQRHARAIATQMPVVVLFATKEENRHSGGITCDISHEHNLTQYIYYYPKKGIFDTLWSQWYYLIVLFRFLPILVAEHGKPLLVHINIAWKPAIWAAVLKLRYDWPLVVTENSTEYQPEAALNIRKLGTIRQRLTKRLFKGCTRFIPVSQQLAKTICDLYGPVPYSVVPNAVDVSDFFPLKRQSAEKFRIIHISTLSWQKNPAGLFRVFDNLLNAGLPLEIVIIGPLTEALLAWKASNAHHAQNIRTTGYMPYASVAAELQQSDLLVLFSRYENLPCVILEALCCGIPVVSTNVGGIAEVINDANGLLVKSEDEVDFENAIRKVIQNYTMFNRSRIAANARALYNYETIGQGFLNAYKCAGITIPSGALAAQAAVMPEH